MNLHSIIQHSRELREKGQGQQVRTILQDLSDHQGSALELAQIGIEMNYAGLFRHAEKILERAAETRDITGFNLYLANSELCISKYAIGKFHDAHALFRSTRLMRDHVIRHLYGWTDDQDFIALIRDKFLGDKPVSGKSILIAHEGGFGDLVMHSRYLRALKNDGARAILVETPPTAPGLFGGDRSIVEVQDIKAALRQVEFITWNFDLFARYQPNPFHYDPEWKVELFPRALAPSTSAQMLLDSARHRLRIGIVSTSSSKVRHEPFRSIPFSALVPLFEALREKSVQFYCLNKGGNLEMDSQAMAEFAIADLGSAIGTFADTAAVLRRLDLVISIDAGPAHLAGALGRPVWLLLSAACDCRWYDFQHCTPWYDSMRLYRQQNLGDWRQPVETVIADLLRLTNPQ